MDFSPTYERVAVRFVEIRIQGVDAERPCLSIFLEQISDGTKGCWVRTAGGPRCSDTRVVLLRRRQLYRSGSAVSPWSDGNDSLHPSTLIRVRDGAVWGVPLQSGGAYVRPSLVAATNSYLKHLDAEMRNTHG